MASIGNATGSITQDGMQMTSNTLTEEQMREALTVGEPEPVEAADPEPVAGDPATTPVDPAAPPKKTKSRDANDAIGKATFEREEAKREAAAAKEEARLAREDAATARREIEESRRGRSEPEPQRQAPVDTDPEPQFEQFAEHGAQQYEKWLQSHVRWGARQEYKEQRQREIEGQREEARERSFREQEQQFRGAIQELMVDPEMATALQRVLIPGDPQHPVTAALMQSEIKKELISHFAKNPTELQQILALPTKIAQYRAMTRVEARLEFSAPPKEPMATAAPSGSAPSRETSKAHAPINPVGASHVAPVSGPPGDDATYEEHQAYWDKEERKAGSRR